MTAIARDLVGRTALVTGAGRNIGRAIALELAAAGAALVLNTRQDPAEVGAVKAEIEAAGGKAVVAVADVTEPAAVEAMARLAGSTFGGLDILVNNAAIRREAPLDAIDLAQWRAITAVILDGAFICVKACLGLLRASRAGAIINIGGLTGHTGAAGRPHVVAAKAGLAGLTRALAHDLAPDGITVNCVVPGLIDTVRKPSSSVAPAHARTHKSLTGAKGASQDVAAAVHYLAGPGARYVTGQSLHVNGGAYLG
ncbi:MAG: SDR family oxidoreductase [Alphaproteobacteria bacterium]|nr:SDR family oxidoreductase [Alphaproteobacteria bacterium]